MPDKEKWWKRPTIKGPFKKIREKIKSKKYLKEIIKKDKEEKEEKIVRWAREKENVVDLGIPDNPSVTKRSDYVYKKGGKIRNMFKEQYD